MSGSPACTARRSDPLVETAPAGSVAAFALALLTVSCQTELWRFTTSGNAPHPVHVHGASFQVQSRKGGRGKLFPWEQGWKDTVLLEDRETVEVLIRFDAFRGLYLIHCHKLEHEDMGMMANFEVV